MTYPPQPGPQGPGPNQQPGGWSPQQPPNQPGSYGAPAGGSTPPPARKKTGLIVGIVAAVVVVIVVVGGGFGWPGFFRSSNSGSSTTANSGSGSGSSSTGSNVADSFGDAATIDPCGWVTPATFAKMAAADPQTQQPQVDIVPQSLNDCHVVISLPQNGGGIIMDLNDGFKVDVTKVKQPNSSAVLSSQGAISFYKQKQTTGIQQCVQFVFLADGSSVELTSGPSVGAADSSGNANPGVDLCGANDAAAAAIASAIHAGQIKRINYPTDSFGTVQACSTLTADQVGSTLQASGISQEPVQGGNHSCTWVNPTASQQQVTPDATFQVQLSSVKNTAQSYQTNKDYVNESTIAGRDSIAWSAPGNPDQAVSCQVETLGKTWSPWAGNQNQTQPGASNTLYEYASVEVIMPSGSQSQVCQMAQTLAAQAWTHLPAAS